MSRKESLKFFALNKNAIFIKSLDKDIFFYYIKGTLLPFLSVHL